MAEKLQEKIDLYPSVKSGKKELSESVVVDIIDDVCNNLKTFDGYEKKLKFLKNFELFQIFLENFVYMFFFWFENFVHILWKTLIFMDSFFKVLNLFVKLLEKILNFGNILIFKILNFGQL